MHLVLRTVAIVLFCTVERAFEDNIGMLMDPHISSVVFLRSKAKSSFAVAHYLRKTEEHT